MLKQATGHGVGALAIVLVRRPATRMLSQSGQRTRLRCRVEAKEQRIAPRTAPASLPGQARADSTRGIVTTKGRTLRVAALTVEL